MQAALEPVAVAVAPRGELAARDVALLDDDGALAGVGQVLRCCQSGGTGPDDQDIRVVGCDQRTYSQG
jgi:hypothetical protein